VSQDDELLDGLPSDERPLPLDRLPYARRVGELVRTPGAAERWRRRCLESFRESRQRHATHKAWSERRAKYVSWEARGQAARSQGPPAEGWVLARGRVFSPDGGQTALVEAWVPPDFGSDREPYAGGPLPFSPRHELSLADCYLVLALVHDADRRDGGRISPFRCDDGRGPAADPDGVAESIFWVAQASHLPGLRAGDQGTLDECLARVEDDLRGPEPRVRCDESDRSVYLDGKRIAGGVDLAVFRFFRVIAEAYPDPIPFKQIQARAAGLYGKHPTRDLKNRLPRKLVPLVRSGKHGFSLELPP
jgi:hypothetical protein